MSGVMQDTIFALSSGAGRSAIAVLRATGPGVRDALMAMIGKVPPARHAALLNIRDPETRRVIDRGLVLFFPGPHSETGEDLAEFQVHGGRAVVAGVLEALASFKTFRPAGPGEFAQRALRNGKMDLLDVEALADLLDAETELQRRQAVEGGGLVLRARADAWRESLLDILADLEAQIDFSDEGDVADQLDSQSERLIHNLIRDMERVLAGGARGERLREGFRVALLGAPNAGKSSLLNALAARDVAIVSPHAGTTRDRIDVALDLGGVPVIVTDTAGLQETQDSVEQEGIRRSLGAAEHADLVLWLQPSDHLDTPPHSLGYQNVKIVRTKSDLPGSIIGPDVWCAISTSRGDGVANLMSLIETLARQSFGDGEPTLLSRSRHVHAVRSAVSCLHRIHRDVAVELVADDVRLACRALEQLVGRIDVEDVLGAIFSRFCIGK